MTRGFSTQPVDSKLISQIVDLASRAPSAGKTQGWHALVITASDTAKFWDDTLAVEKRESFRWKQLLDAPVIALVFADPLAYVERYSEHDKAHTGLGASAERNFKSDKGSECDSYPPKRRPNCSPQRLVN